MLIELWFSKLKEHAQRIVREGRIGDCDGRKCFLHPELFSHVLPCRCRRDEVEDDASFLARMLAFEEINTRVIRQLLDLDRRIRCGEIEESEHLLVVAVRNSLDYVRSVRDGARSVIRALFKKQ